MSGVGRRLDRAYDGADSETQQWVQKGGYLRVVTKRVCHACNTGWMERLETEARAILMPLLRGQQRMLTPDDQRVIARWAAKTAFALESTRPEQLKLKREDIRFVREHDRPPSHLQVRLARCGTSIADPFVYRGVDGFGIVRVDGTVVPDGPQTVVVTWQMGRLVVQLVASYTDLFPEDNSYSDATVLVWPSSSQPLGFPAARDMTSAEYYDFSCFTFPDLLD